MDRGEVVGTVLLLIDRRTLLASVPLRDGHSRLLYGINACSRT